MAKTHAGVVQPRRRAQSRRIVDVGAVRREEIIDAAAATIAEQGIQRLSLSEIESRTGMSRGQLTYYFPEKEQILLAVFDRTVSRMRQRVAEHRRTDPAEHMADVLEMIMFRPMTPEFVALQYTFLAQTGHRADFRQRLAKLYERWRAILLDELDAQPVGKTGASARTRASLFQAVAHGLAVQLVADAKAFNRKEMTVLCHQLFALITNAKPKRAATTSKPKGRRHV